MIKPRLILVKPIYEKIQPNPGSSFSVFEYKLQENSVFPFWHIHPEYEITYIEKGKGSRHIGNHFSFYEDGDLLMLGPGIPHSNFSNNDFPVNNTEIIIQINSNLINNELFKLTEFLQIKKLFEKSCYALSFSGSTKVKAGKIMKKLAVAKPFEKLVLLLSLLNELSESKEFEVLSSDQIALSINSSDYLRLSKIFNWVGENFERRIKIDEIAEIAGVTKNSFCRFFKKTTGQSFINYLNEFRLKKVCELIINEDTSIKNIFFRCGFNEPAYFSRLFKKAKGMSPLEYKRKKRNSHK